MSCSTKEKVLTKELAKQIDKILAAYEHDGSHLVGILLDVQEIVPAHYIPEEVAYYLSQELNVKITNVYDCITFYASIHDKPRAKYPLEICNSIVCKVNDSDNLFARLKEILNVELGQATEDGKFILESVPCFGACDRAPAVRVNGKVYGNLDTKEKITAMLKELA